MDDRSNPAEQSLNEFFQCHICYERLKNPHLCPHCSKPCCLECYKRWLMTEQPNCPFCRAHLLTHELVKCRWLKEIIDQLDQVLTSQVRGGRREGDERDWCPTHKERLSVFCKTCLRCICSNCALFGGQHTGHEFAQVDEIYQQHLQTLVTQASRLRQHLVDIARKAKKVDRAMERVLLEKDNHERMTVIAVEHIMKRLEKGAEDKIRQLSEAREKMNDGGESISHYLVDLERKINSGCKSDVITQAFTLRQTRMPFLQDTNEQELSRIAHFTNEIVPGYEPKSFKLEKFSVARQRGEVVYSAPLRVGGLTWRLKVYPDGCNNVGRGKYLSVFLELKDGFAKTTTYEYRIQLLWQGGRDASKDLIREHASEFALGESWGYNKFCKLDYLVQDGYLQPGNDTLHFRFGVRCQTYHQQCKDMGLYVHNLERQKSHMTKRIRHLEQKLRHEVNRNRSRGQPPEDTPSQSTTRTPDIRRGSNDLEEETSLTSPSHHTEEEEGTRNSEEAAPGSSIRTRFTQLREMSVSVQDMKSWQASRQLWSEEADEEQLSSEHTQECIGPQETDLKRRTWDSAHHRSQSADSKQLYQSVTLPRSSRIQLAPSSQASLPQSSQTQPNSSSDTTEAEELATNPPGGQHPWDAPNPQAPWGDEYDAVETSQHSPTAAPDMAFWGDQPPPSSSKLNFTSDLSQNRQSQSPTEHLRRTIDQQDMAIHVDDPQYGISDNDSIGYHLSLPQLNVDLSQQFTQEEDWVGATVPPPQQRKRDVGHTHQPHKSGNLSRLTSEPYLAPPGLKSSVLAALGQDIPPPPLTQYDSQSQQRHSVFGDANERHAASQMSAGMPAGRRQYRRGKSHHHRSQEKLQAAARSTSSSSLNRIRN